MQFFRWMRTSHSAYFGPCNSLKNDIPVNETRHSAVPETLPREPNTSVVSRAATRVAIAVVAVILVAMFWFAKEVFLLSFAGILFGVLLRSLGNLVHKYTGLSSGWALTVVVLSGALLIGEGGALLAPSLAEQMDQLLTDLPHSTDALKKSLRHYKWGQQLLAQDFTTDGWLSSAGNFSGKVLGVFSTTFGVAGGVLIILSVGLFLAWDPETYTNGVIRLTPLAKRDRIRQVLRESAHTLRWWLLGRGIAMLFVGAVTFLGLWLLGIPFAAPLALLTTLLGFVPFFGPIIAVVPAALLGYLESPWKGAAVVVLYLIVQVLEGNVLTPLVQSRAVNVPPAITIVAILLIGVLFGSLGMVLAMPLTAVGFVFIKRLYVEDVLGDRIDGS